MCFVFIALYVFLNPDNKRGRVCFYCDYTVFMNVVFYWVGRLFSKQALNNITNFKNPLKVSVLHAKTWFSLKNNLQI